MSDNDVFCSNCGASADGLISPNENKPAPAQNKNSSGELSPLAIVGFVLAFVASLAGLICSIIAYKQAVEVGNEKSKSFARTGIILSAVFMGISFLVGIIAGIAIAVNADDIVNNTYPYYN